MRPFTRQWEGEQNIAREREQRHTVVNEERIRRKEGKLEAGFLEWHDNGLHIAKLNRTYE
jgi:hypothetical protein